jgi:3-deoxy-D-manno-octulosonic-acid transferase
VAELVADPPHSMAMARRGQSALAQFEGAVARTLAVLDPYVAQMKLSARDRV